MVAVTCRIASISLCALVLGACGGGGGGGGSTNTPAPTTYTVGGTITGLAGTGLVLQNNGGNNLTVPANGSFTFASALSAASAYSVTVLTQPSAPTQTCAVTNGSGSVGSANVTNVAVACTTNAYSVGGSVTGLTASGLVLQNNGANDLAISANGNFTFPTTIASGAPYAITIKTQPNVGPAQTCSVTTGAGTVTNAAVTTVNVACTTQVARFLYSANSGSNTVSAYSINAATGALTPIGNSPFAADQAPLFMSANRAGTALYVANQGSAGAPPRISAYSIHGTTGALTPVTGSPFDLSHAPPPPNGQAAVGKPIIHPSGAFGYLGVRGTPAFYGATVDPASGSLSEIAGMPSIGLGQGFGAFDAAGKVVYVPHNNFNGGMAGAISAYTANSPSGVLTVLGSFPTGGSMPGGITFNSAGTLLLTANNSASVSVFTVDALSGTLTAAPGSPFSTGAGTTPTSVAIHRNGTFVYVTSTHSMPALSSVAAFQMNTTTGALTPVPGSPFLTGGTQAAVAAVDPSGKFLFVTNSGSDNIQAFAIDQTTGALTPVPGSPFATPLFPAPLVIDPSGKYLYSVNTGAGSVTAFSINPTTGALTQVNTVQAGNTPRFPELVGLQ